MNHIEWIATTQKSQWQSKDQLTVSAASNSKWDVKAYLDQPLQTIEGFGACFNELGWTSLNTLASADRESILRELFAPGVGANFNTCRMPVGANDFSLDWYSYDEVPGDFALDHFSISKDLETLVLFINNALKYQPALKLWASSWSTRGRASTSAWSCLRTSLTPLNHFRAVAGPLTGSPDLSLSWDQRCRN